MRFRINDGDRDQILNTTHVDPDSSTATLVGGIEGIEKGMHVEAL